MKTLKYAAIAVVMFLAAGSLFLLNSRAAQSAVGDGPPNGKLRERIKQKLNLTDDQVAQIKSQLKFEKDNLKSLLTRLHDTRIQLSAEIQKPDASETSVREAAARLSAVESDLAVERLKLYSKINPILTADQRAKLAQFEVGIDQFFERAISRMGTRLSE